MKLFDKHKNEKVEKVK